MEIGVGEIQFPKVGISRLVCERDGSFEEMRFRMRGPSRRRWRGRRNVIAEYGKFISSGVESFTGKLQPSE